MTRTAETFAQGAAVFAVAILLAGLMSLPVRQAIRSSNSEAIGPVKNQSPGGKLFTERLGR